MHILDVIHGIFVICGKCVTLHTVGSRSSISWFEVICAETQITLKPCFSPYFSLSYCRGIRPRSATWRHMRRIGAHSGQVALVCHSSALSCGFRNFRYMLYYGDANSAQKSCIASLPNEYTSGKQNTRQIARFQYLWCFWFSFCKGYMVN